MLVSPNNRIYNFKLFFCKYLSGTTHAISDALEQYELRESSDTVPGLPNVASRGLKRSDSNRIGNRRVSLDFLLFIWYSEYILWTTT